MGCRSSPSSWRLTAPHATIRRVTRFSASLGLSLCLLAGLAFADVTARLDASAMAIVNDPQRTYYLPGPEGAAGLYWGVATPLDVFATIGFGFTPRANASPLEGPASGFRASLGARLRPPQRTSRYVPFGEVSVGTVLTGGVPTFGLQAGTGVLFRVGKQLFLGPRLGFQQVFRVAPITAWASADATFFSLGLSFEFPVFSTIEDTDGDGVLDPDDKCPTTRGLAAFDGCPPPPDVTPVAPPQVVKPAPTLLRARLVDLEDRPVNGVLRFPRLDGRERSFEASPSVEVELKPGEYRIEAEADGYLVRGRTVTLKEGETLSTDFVLRPIPRVKTASLQKNEVVINQQINFEFGKSTILPDSFFILDEVTDILLRNPQLKQVRVEGHTDDVGGVERNQVLSEDRALAVAKYLLEHGVEPNRVQSQGFGLSKPIASNKTDAGRAKNRRVQFRIIEQ